MATSTSMFMCGVIALFVCGALADTPGNCDVYHSTSSPDNCKSNCGDCFNPGSRAGVLCTGTTTGYYCPIATDAPVSSFACMDWTFGSTSMRAAESAFNARSGNPAVYFGVGTYGTAADPQRGLGACYHLDVTGMDRPLLV